MTDEIRHDYEPARPVHPGEILADEIEARGMSQVDLARRMGRPQQKISEILHGKRAVTPETAIELSRVLGVTATLWNNLQMNYELDRARIRQKAALTAQARLLGRFPVAELVDQGWLPTTEGRLDTLRQLLAFLGVASLKAWDEVTKAMGTRASSGRLPTPTALWLRKGEIEASGLVLDHYSARRFRLALDELATPAPERGGGIVEQAVEVCARAGVALVVVGDLQGLDVTGAARWLSPRRPLIQLSARLAGSNRFMSALFHGACHVLKHGKSRIYLEPSTPQSTPDSREAEAHAFASERLKKPKKPGTRKAADGGTSRVAGRPSTKAA